MMIQNNLVTYLSKHLKQSVEETTSILDCFCEVLCSQLEEEKFVHLPPLGFMFVKMNNEYTTEDTVTRKQYLHPPKLTISLSSEQEIQKRNVGKDQEEPLLCNTEDLAELLTDESGKNIAECSIFIHELLRHIADNSNSKQGISLPNFGNFKRQETEGKGKIIFEAETKVAARINKPFSIFEIVELAEGGESEEHPEPEPIPQPEPIAEQAEIIAPTPDPAPTVQQLPTEETTPETEPKSEERDEPCLPTPAETGSRLPIIMEQSPDKGKNRKTGYWILCLLIFVACQYLLVSSLMDKQDIGSKLSQNNTPLIADSMGQPKNNEAKAVQAKPSAVLPIDTTNAQKANTASETDADKTAEMQSKEEIEQSITEEKNDEIITTIKVKKGDRLVDYALKYYGNKLFWIYIYDYNKAEIRNDHTLYVGSKIRIPAKDLYNIDANNAQSIEEAKKHSYNSW